MCQPNSLLQENRHICFVQTAIRCCALPRISRNTTFRNTVEGIHMTKGCWPSSRRSVAMLAGHCMTTKVLGCASASPSLIIVISFFISSYEIRRSYNGSLNNHGNVGHSPMVQFAVTNDADTKILVLIFYIDFSQFNTLRTFKNCIEAI